jgi:hypothetical protein
MKATITKSGYVAGGYHEKGEVLELTERQFNTGVRRGRVEAAEGDETQNAKTAVGDEVLEIRAKLDALGIKYHPRSKADKLREQLEEAQGL